MKIFNSIQFSNYDEAATCQNCAWFQNNPAVIEEAFQGLAIMSSGFASVRDRDGLCNQHQLYLSARDKCADFTLCPSS